MAGTHSRSPRSLQPDVLLMDVSMPVMNGLEAANPDPQTSADGSRC